jgi:hypothetical protein
MEYYEWYAYVGSQARGSTLARKRFFLLFLPFYHISKNKLSQKVFLNFLSCFSPDATYEAVGVTIESCCLF